MAIDPTALAGLLVAGGAMVSALAAFQQSRAARTASKAAERDSASKVNIEAFLAAKGLWEGSVKDHKAYIEEQRLLVIQLRKDLYDARVELESVKAELAQEKFDRKFLQARVHELELTIGRLTERLKQAGVTFKDGVDEPEAE